MLQAPNYVKANTYRKLIKSMPREEMLLLAREQSNLSTNQTMIVDNRKLGQSSSLNWQKFIKKRPTLPKAQNFKIAKIELTVASTSGRNTQV